MKSNAAIGFSPSFRASMHTPLTTDYSTGSPKSYLFAILHQRKPLGVLKCAYAIFPLTTIGPRC